MSNIRKQKLDVMLSESEVEQVRQDAAKAGLSISHYVRKRLKLEIPKRGRPPTESKNVPRN